MTMGDQSEMEGVAARDTKILIFRRRDIPHFLSFMSLGSLTPPRGAMLVELLVDCWQLPTPCLLRANMYTRIKEKEGESNALSSTRWQQSHVLTCCYADPCCCAARMPQPVDHKLENHRPNDGPMSAFDMRYTKEVQGSSHAAGRGRGRRQPVAGEPTLD